MKWKWDCSSLTCIDSLKGGKVDLITCKPSSPQDKSVFSKLNRSAVSKLEGTPPLGLLNIGRNVRVIGEATAIAVHKNSVRGNALGAYGGSCTMFHKGL
jgi:hypothetical protein